MSIHWGRPGKKRKEKKIQRHAEFKVEKARALEDLKAISVASMDEEKLLKAMACIYVGTMKKPAEEKKSSGGKPFSGTPRPLELSQGAEDP